MKVETGVAEVLDAFAKLFEVAGAAAKRHGDFHAFAKIETLEAGLRSELWLRYAEIADHTGKIAPQRGNGSVIANVEGREQFGQVIPVRGGERPLRKIVRKAFREKVVGSQGLKGVMEDGSVAAMFEAVQQFRQGSRRLVSDSGQVRSGYEVEGCFGDVQFCSPLHP